MDSDWKAGLEDVIAARSGVCTIDGGAGRLYYRGYEIGDLAGAVPFEDVTRLLWFGELPTAAEAGSFRARLRETRPLPAPLAALLRTLPATRIRSTPSARPCRSRPPSIPTSAPAIPRRTCARHSG